MRPTTSRSSMRPTCCPYQPLSRASASDIIAFTSDIDLSYQTSASAGIDLLSSRRVVGGCCLWDGERGVALRAFADDSVPVEVLDQVGDFVVQPVPYALGVLGVVGDRRAIGKDHLLHQESVVVLIAGLQLHADRVRVG